MGIRAAIGAFVVVTLLPATVHAVDYDFASVYGNGTVLAELGATEPSVNTSGTIAFAALVFDPAHQLERYFLSLTSS